MPAEVAVTVNVYSVLDVKPVTVNVVPLCVYDPPPLKTYAIVFAEPPRGAVNVTVAVVVLVALATTFVGAAIYVCIAVADAFVELVLVVAITLNVYAVLAINPVTVYVVPVSEYDPPPLKSYAMVFAEPPSGATNVTVAVVALVAVATTDVG